MHDRTLWLNDESGVYTACANMTETFKLMRDDVCGGRKEDEHEGMFALRSKE